MRKFVEIQLKKNDRLCVVIHLKVLKKYLRKMKVPLLFTSVHILYLGINVILPQLNHFFAY